MINGLLLFALLILPPFALAAPNIMVFGDSLSASHGFDQKKGWVSLLSQRLSSNGYEYQVINASISGETTRGALARIGKLLDNHQPQIVIIELGGNDGLQGLSINKMQNNIANIIEQCLDHESEVLLTGMQIPPNYGREYSEEFANSYKRIAKRYKIGLLPFLLSGFGSNKALFQSDGIHPTPSAQAHILENVWKYLAPMLPVTER